MNSCLKMENFNTLNLQVHFYKDHPLNLAFFLTRICVMDQCFNELLVVLFDHRTQEMSAG